MQYGRIRELTLRGGKGGAPFGFVEFDDARDAEDAVYGRDGYKFGGQRIRLATSPPRSAPWLD